MQNALAYGLLLLAAADPATGLALPVYQRPAQEQRLVNGRDLHEALGIGKDYTTWIKDRIGRHRFKHGTDYVMLEPDKNLLPESGKQNEESIFPKVGKNKTQTIFPKTGENKIETRGRKRTEYALSLDAAKIVAMGTNNEVGDTIKRYFLYCEKLAFSTPDYTIQPVVTLDKWLPGLEEHTTPRFQRQQALRLQKLLREKAGANAVIRHGRGACLSQTGLGAREIIQLGQAVGLPAKYRTSAREVLRHMAPAVACAMSLYDALTVFGAEPEAAGRVAGKAQELFQDILNLGTYPVELVPFVRFPVDRTPSYYL